jgi:hypothetical protein
LRLASDHAKFMRNYADPTQERLFRTADHLAVTLDGLRGELAALPEPVPPPAMFSLIQRATPVLRTLNQFKTAVANLIETCQTQHLLPAHFIDHLRREVEFFLGIVDHVLGRPSQTRGALDMGGPSQAAVSTLARNLIDKVPTPEAIAAGLTWTEFWGKHNMEHADALTILLRPQDVDLIQGAARFSDRFKALLQETVQIDLNNATNQVAQLNRDTLTLTGDWRRFLEQALEAQRSCKAQENFPQRLTEHIMIETDFMTEAALRVQARQSGRFLSEPMAMGATFDQLTPKQILLS